jgi:large conductance mechanosensitive channel
MGIYAEFKKFLIQGNLITMAVAFVVGLAVVALIGALVTDIIDPLIAAAFQTNFASLGVLTINHSAVLFGALIGAAINFLILMLVVFLLIAYPYQKYQDRQKAKAAATPPTTRECPMCLNQIPLKASRCGFCTSAVTPVTA